MFEYRCGKLMPPFLFNRLNVSCWIQVMISDAGADWEEEVLSDLRNDMSQSIEDASSVQLSIQDKIIVTSLNGITGKDAEQTKERFFQYAPHHCPHSSIVSVSYSAKISASPIVCSQSFMHRLWN